MKSKRLRKIFLNDSNIVGWSIEPDEQIIVFVKDRKKFLASYPSTLFEKFKFKIYVTDEIIPLSSNFRKVRHESLAGGISIGFCERTTGTLSAVVRDLTDGEYVLLSNWHVFGYPTAKIGEPIIQPGVIDGGSLKYHVVGKLKRYVKIGKTLVQKILKINENNTVDAAIATCESRKIIPFEVYLDDGSTVKISGESEPKIGDEVWKSGRTTGITYGKILATNAQITVDYGYNLHLMKEQIITTFMGEHGDSGSLLLDKNNRVLGLLFAGSSTITVHNKWFNVKSLLKVDVK